jgi:hypothetical protein
MSVLARGWATVELDRAATELVGLLVPGTGFDAAGQCVHLGASCRIGQLATPTVETGRWLVLLEPFTEGRLAVTLARHGEGWCATWFDADPGGSGTRTGPRDGPLGAERLLLDGPSSGPHRLVVDAATIDR